MAVLMPEGKQSFTNSAGVPLVGGKVYTYDAGTSTPRTTYQDSAGTTPNTNPVILDARGEATIFWSGAYKVVLKDAADATVWSVDGVVSSDAYISAISAAIDLFGASTGTSLSGHIASGAGAVATTAQTKLRECVSVNDYWIGATDATVATQNALNESKQVKFLSGTTYNLTGDIQIPADRKIIVEKGATVINTGGRFTAYDVDNVEWQIDGWVKSVAMATAPAKTGWPAPTNPNITDIGNCRGFIEFGSATYNVPRSGFKVSGSGRVSADWSGTPMAANAVEVNFRGIVAFTASNVLVEDIEVFGFRGEAVHTTSVTTLSKHIHFHNVYSHDNQFDNLNFNVIGPCDGLLMSDCTSVNGYIGIELSGGSAINNTVISPLLTGIFFGRGYASDYLNVSGNVVKDAGQISYDLTFVSSAPSKTIIQNNQSYNPGQNAYLVGKCNGLNLTGNVSVGHAQTSVGYAFNISNCRFGLVADNTSMLPGGFSSGTLYNDPTNLDLLFGNVYTPSQTGIAPVSWGYSEGSFTPVAVNLTTVGTGVVLTGTYTKIGREVLWSVLVTPIGATTSAATISVTQFTGLPFTAAEQSTCQAATAAIGQLQNGLVLGATVWAPTWAATNAPVILNGMYRI